MKNVFKFKLEKKNLRFQKESKDFDLKRGKKKETEIIITLISRVYHPIIDHLFRCRATHDFQSLEYRFDSIKKPVGLIIGPRFR